MRARFLVDLVQHALGLGALSRLETSSPCFNYYTVHSYMNKIQSIRVDDSFFLGGGHRLKIWGEVAHTPCAPQYFLCPPVLCICITYSSLRVSNLIVTQIHSESCTAVSQTTTLWCTPSSNDLTHGDIYCSSNTHLDFKTSLTKHCITAPVLNETINSHLPDHSLLPHIVEKQRNYFIHVS